MTNTRTDEIEELTSIVVRTTSASYDHLISEITEALNRAESATGRTSLIIQVSARDIRCALPKGVLSPASIQSITKWERLLRRLERSDVPSAIVIEDGVSPVALELLLVGDLRICLSGTAISFPALNDHCWPGMFLFRLTKLIGLLQAQRLLKYAGEMSPASLVQLGVADREVPSTDDAHTLAEEFFRTTPDNYGLCRRLLEECYSLSFEEALGLHLAACDRTLRAMVE